MLITVDNYLWHEDRRIDLLDFEISQDWDTYLWTGQIQPAYFADYLVLKTGDPVILYLQGTPYQLVIESRSHSDSDGLPTFTAQVSSPSVALEKTKITKTWNAITARNVCEELAGDTIEWSILNWTIPSGRLSVVEKTPIDIIRMIVNAAGGIIQTRADGILKAQYKTGPTAFNQINLAPLSATYTDKSHILSYSESPPSGEFYNAAIISDEEQSDRQYYAEYEKIDEVTGKLKIYAEPWFEDFRVTHTGHDLINISAGTIKFLKQTETVEFKESQATVNYPIFSFQSIEWQYNDLGAINWHNKNLSVSGDNQYSTAIVRYTRRYIEFPVSHLLNSATQTQFLIIECSPDDTDPICD